MNAGLQIGPHPQSPYSDISSLRWYGTYGWKQQEEEEPVDIMERLDDFLGQYGLDPSDFQKISWKVNSALSLMLNQFPLANSLFSKKYINPSRPIGGDYELGSTHMMVLSL